MLFRENKGVDSLIPLPTRPDAIMDLVLVSKEEILEELEQNFCCVADEFKVAEKTSWSVMKRNINNWLY